MGGLRRYAATSLIVALSPGHSDITRFRLWTSIATGNHLDRAEKNPKFAQTTGTVDVFSLEKRLLTSSCPSLHVSAVLSVQVHTGHFHEHVVNIGQKYLYFT